MYSLALSFTAGSSVLPLFLLGSFPEEKTFFQFLEQDVGLFLLSIGVIWSILLALLLPLLVEEVVNHYFELRRITKENQHLSRSLFETNFLIATMTGLQGLVWFCWAAYRGQISSVSFLDVSWARSFAGEQVPARVAYLAWTGRAIILILVSMLAADVTSYAYHRLCHENRFLYNTLHSVHHEQRFPHNAFSSLHYASILDIFFSNICYFSGTFLFPTDMATITIYGIISTITTSLGHSGISPEGTFLEFWTDPRMHDLHHNVFPMANYAEHFSIVDKLMGTYKDPKKHYGKVRVPARKLKKYI